MVQIKRGMNIDLYHTKVTMDALVFGIRDDMWMPHWILTVLVHPVVQGRDVNVFDRLTLSLIDFVTESDYIRTSAKESIPWLERLHEL